VPVLERIAGDYAGRLLLAKVNIDEEQEIAAHFGIRSIPTVVLMLNGQVADQFVGVQPEATIRSMLDRRLPADGDPAGAQDAVAKANALAQAGDTAGAVRIIEDALAERPAQPVLLATLAGLQLLAHDATGARASVARIESQDPMFPMLASLRARLGFLEAASAWPDAAAARAAVAADPGDPVARHALAAHHALAGDYAEALEEWLALMQRNRGYGDDVARRSMLAVFDLLGSSDEHVVRFRRRLASMLH
jgi:putative thioredoxin